MYTLNKQVFLTSLGAFYTSLNTPWYGGDLTILLSFFMSRR